MQTNQPTSSRVYLCHKCAGLLSHNSTDLPLSRCGCMSGYVRDGQNSFSPLEAWQYAVNAHIGAVLWLERRQADGDTQRASTHYDALQTLAEAAPQEAEEGLQTVPPIFEGMKPQLANWRWEGGHIKIN